jgi:release factor glutamine methyltransferase
VLLDRLPAEAAGRYAELVEQRAARVPLQHLTGVAGFRRLDLAVGPGVFVPRPETEVLVERCLALLEGVQAPRFADVGTGSGAIALAVKSARPDASVTATDVSADALAVARENATALGLEVELAETDLLAGVEGRFAVIASNPPYIGEAEMAALEPEVAEYEPRLATVAGPAGTEVLERLAAAAAAALEAGGSLVVECGAGQAEAVRGLMAAAGAGETTAEPDLAGIDRVVTGRWP